MSLNPAEYVRAGASLRSSKYPARSMRSTDGALIGASPAVQRFV